uniref:Inter-alpha-trypsin inhibitor heavy chain H3 n=2 Tax=Cyprinus carpio TaxID=7962 RepID=A0A8C1F3P9_CYPCA
MLSRLPKNPLVAAIAILLISLIRNENFFLLLRASGRNMEKFSVSVNILLQRRLGIYEIMLAVHPTVQNIEIVVDIYEPKGTAFVDVNGTFITNQLLPLVKKTVTDKKVPIKTFQQSPSIEDTLIDGDLFIKYDVNHPQDIDEIQIINCYFTREALMTILSELHEDDYLGPFLSKATPENVRAVKEFVRTIKARNNMSMIILLTDGRPNQQDLSKIQENVRNSINGSTSLFCLGIGYDVDYSLLDTLAKHNDGLTQRVYEASDAALQLQVNLNYPGNAVTDLTQSHFRQFFKGSEIVVAGRLQELETNTFQTEVSAHGLEDQFVVEGLAIAEEWDGVFPDQEYIFGDFTEEQCSPEDKENVTAEALDLSLRYNFVTPLTSMVVTKPETEDEDEPLIAAKLTEGTLSFLNFKDPHFIIELPDQNDALCYNIDDKPGTIFNLGRDPLTGIVVNGQIIGDKKIIPGNKMHTYFGRFGIVHEKFGIRLMVSTKEISVSENKKLKHSYHQDYLGFYTLDSHHLSNNVHGLLGQFYHGVNFEVSDLFPGKDPDKQDANMFVKGNKLTDVKSSARVHTDYIISGLFKSV